MADKPPTVVDSRPHDRVGDGDHDTDGGGRHDDEAGPGRQPGWREVIAVAGLLVAIVLGAAIVTSVLPTGIQELVFHTPLAIVVLIIGTAWLLWRISRRTGSAQP